ncbi:hypothetical protein JZ751_029514 [Albula glossodonta]|uniref:Uncharacterized protein n=1 Tax=Albula glossodonta TaxID=121402 RepID=A0A8T2NA98_9TELE|nr:hypothetical protein JZ751_029514 [Albula glossodonta]
MELSKVTAKLGGEEGLARLSVSHHKSDFNVLPDGNQRSREEMGRELCFAECPLLHATQEHIKAASVSSTCLPLFPSAPKDHTRKCTQGMGDSGKDNEQKRDRAKQIAGNNLQITTTNLKKKRFL